MNFASIFQDRWLCVPKNNSNQCPNNSQLIHFTLSTHCLSITCVGASFWSASKETCPRDEHHVSMFFWAHTVSQLSYPLYKMLRVTFGGQIMSRNEGNASANSRPGLSIYSVDWEPRKSGFTKGIRFRPFFKHKSQTC